MEIPWATLRSLLLFLGPLLLPKAVTYYRAARDGPRRQGLKIVPVPIDVSRALAVLFAAAALLLVCTLPALTPENVFVRTGSRAAVPVDVLFARLAALRPLTPRDELLRARLVSPDARLVYLHLGPSTLADCPFCAPDSPRSYLYYALPALLLPHVANMAALALAAVAAPQYGPRWSTLATVAVAALAAADLYLTSAYNPAARPGLPMFWTLRLYRLLGLAALDAVLGWVLFLASTNRAFVRPVGAAARLDTAVQQLAAARARLSAVAISTNTAARDPGLRAGALAYWSHEVRLMAEVMEDRPVVDAVNNALLSDRIDIAAITRDADTYTTVLLGGLKPPPANALSTPG